MNEQETIAAAMSLLGRRTSEAKRAAWAANRLKTTVLGCKRSEETKAKMKAAQVRRRERERQQAEREGLAG